MVSTTCCKGAELRCEFRRNGMRSAVMAILSRLRTMRMSAKPALITTEKYFREAGVVWMGKKFRDEFLGLKVFATNEGEIAIYLLEGDSSDFPILTCLGDEAKISVSQFHSFLAENRKTPGWFVFYLEGKDGNLYPVGAGKGVNSDGWDVDAHAIGRRSGYAAGGQFLSRI